MASEHLFFTNLAAGQAHSETWTLLTGSTRWAVDKIRKSIPSIPDFLKDEFLFTVGLDSERAVGVVSDAATPHWHAARWKRGAAPPDIAARCPYPMPFPGKAWGALFERAPASQPAFDIHKP